MFPRWMFIFLSFTTAVLTAAEDRYATVVIAPAKTSIYVGTVTLTMPTFERRGSRFESVYMAKVFPYFFYNESGALGIDFSAEQLSRLALSLIHI